MMRVGRKPPGGGGPLGSRGRTIVSRRRRGCFSCSERSVTSKVASYCGGESQGCAPDYKLSKKYPTGWIGEFEGGDKTICQARPPPLKCASAPERTREAIVCAEASGPPPRERVTPSIGQRGADLQPVTMPTGTRGGGAKIEPTLVGCKWTSGGRAGRWRMLWSIPRRPNPPPTMPPTFAQRR